MKPQTRTTETASAQPENVRVSSQRPNETGDGNTPRLKDLNIPALLAGSNPSECVIIEELKLAKQTSEINWEAYREAIRLLDQVTAQRDELKEQVAILQSQIDNNDVTLAQVRLNEEHKRRVITAQRDELLAALHCVSHDIADAMLWIQSKTESHERKFQGVVDMLNRSRKQRIAAIQ